LNWGNTSFLLNDDEFYTTIYNLSDKWLREKEIGDTNYDVSVQVTIPNEFEKLAKVNVGITAGIEVNLCSPEWIVKANNNIDILFVPSYHSKEVFEQTKFQDQNGNILQLNKPVHVVHEGFDNSLFTVEPNDKELFSFDTPFNFLFVGLGISQQFGEERKNISNLVKWFCETFKDNKEVGLVLKTAVVNNSLMDFESTKATIQNIKNLLKINKINEIS
jgi:hypothetical protein